MRIGVMLRNIGEKGGIVVYATNLLKNLFAIDKKNEYHLLYARPEDRGRFGAFPNVQEALITAPNKLWWDQVSVPQYARKEKLDVIYNPKLSIPLFTRCKTVWVMHGGEHFVIPGVFKWHDRLYFSVANRLYAKKASAIITMTHLGAADIVKYTGADPRKMHVIHESYNELCHVVDKESLRPIRQKYGLPERFILFVGGLTPLKNFGNILRAYQKIKNAIPHKIVLVGFKRWKFNKDLQLLEQLKLQDNVKFTGFVPDQEISAFYNLAELFVFPSLYEGFGIPTLEAMACGCPLIASKTGCSPEVVQEAALLVDPYNPDEIADAIRKIFSDAVLRNRLIEQGLTRVKYFSWNKCAKETLALFESL